MTVPFQFRQEFRQQWLGIFTTRADSLFELIDALLLSLDPRSPIELSLTAVAADQVKRLVETVSPSQRAVVVADSHYAQRTFLAAFLNVPNVFALGRLACNRVLYYSPPPQAAQRLKGRPRLHGDKFKRQAPPEAERHETFQFAQVRVRANAWTGLHCKDLAALVGTVMPIEFLKADGQPMDQRPLWLFGSGPTSFSLEALCLM